MGAPLMAAEAVGAGAESAGAGAAAGRAGSARGAAKSKGGARRKAASPGPMRHQPTSLTNLHPDDHAEELDLRKQDAAWAKEERAAGRDPDRSTFSGEEPSVPDGTDDDGTEDTEGPAPSSAPSSSGGRRSIRVPDVGGGALLGFMGWVVGLAYLRGGSDEVKKLLRAKFLNRTD